MPDHKARAGKRTIESPPPVWRNFVVSGIHLIALKNSRVRTGQALLEMVGPCQPCSLMEEAVGPGGSVAPCRHQPKLIAVSNAEQRVPPHRTCSTSGVPRPRTASHARRVIFIGPSILFSRRPHGHRCGHSRQLPP
jgi:hypothetical protein